MLDATEKAGSKDAPAANAAQEKTAAPGLPVWEKPALSEVSEQVMAQPYIRFT